MMKKLQSTEQI